MRILLVKLSLKRLQLHLAKEYDVRSTLMTLHSVVFKKIPKTAKIIDSFYVPRQIEGLADLARYQPCYNSENGEILKIAK